MIHFTHRNRLASVGAFALAFALILGCDNPDTEKEFDEFAAATEDQRSGSNGATGDAGLDDVTVAKVDFSGEFFTTITTTLGSLTMKTTATVMMDDTINFELQALTPEASDTPRMPVGEVFTASAVAYEDNGSFRISLGEIVITGAANGISGTDITIADLVLVGLAPDADQICGVIEGMITAPIPLELTGSATWGATKIAADIAAATILDACPAGVSNASNGGMDAGMDVSEDVVEDLCAEVTCGAGESCDPETGSCVTLACAPAENEPTNACADLPDGDGNGIPDAYEAEYAVTFTDADENGMAPLGEIAGNCGRTACIGMLGQDGFKDCVKECIAEVTNDALPTDCLFCVAITVDCGASACIGDCLNDTGNCTPCLCENGAYDSLVSCSGIEALGAACDTGPCAGVTCGAGETCDEQTGECSTLACALGDDEPTGACDSLPDDDANGVPDAYEAEYAVTFEDADMNGMAPLGEIASNCGRTACIGMLGQDGFKDCVKECIAEITVDALPTDCLFCLAITVDCGASACIGDCINDTGNCTPCLCENGAYEALAACSGIESLSNGPSDDMCP